MRNIWCFLWFRNLDLLLSKLQEVADFIKLKQEKVGVVAAELFVERFQQGFEDGSRKSAEVKTLELVDGVEKSRIAL